MTLEQRFLTSKGDSTPYQISQQEIEKYLVFVEFSQLRLKKNCPLNKGGVEAMTTTKSKICITFDCPKT